MALPLHSSYQQFQQRLQQLQVQLADAAPPKLKADIADLQQIFQSQIVPLAESTEAALSMQLQSIHTEINKQLRLLETDGIFLQAARQPATAQQRKQQIQQRLDLLLQYCAASLALQSQLQSQSDSASDEPVGKPEPATEGPPTQNN